MSPDQVAVSVAVVIPALDEEQAIAAVLSDLARTARPPGLREPRSWTLSEIVVVDNGSRDRTAEVAGSAGATVVREPRRGYGAACLAGLAALRERPPEIVAFLDADGSDDAIQLEAVLAPIVAGEAEMVIGSRVLGSPEPGSLTAVQAFGNRLAAFLLRAMFGMHATDLGPFRAIRWDTLERLGMRDRDFGWTVEMQARAARARVRMTEVAVRYRRRSAGRSKVSGSLRGSIAAGAKILWTIARVRLGM